MSHFIEVKGARANNLKSIDANIPHGMITVVTGVSGSGKSSLAFETIYAEGQRRFIESMSSYVRQFLGKLNKPAVDYIKGLSPTIAVQQKVISHNPRSTVGTVTEIYDYLKLLYAREGITYSPLSGERVKKDRPNDILQFLLGHENEFSFAVMFLPRIDQQEAKERYFQQLSHQGFVRVWMQNEMRLINEQKEWPDEPIYAVVDRFKTNRLLEEEHARVLDSIQLALDQGSGECYILSLADKTLHLFNGRFERDGMVFQEPTLQFFAFNNPYGACKTCEGFGSVLGIDPKLVIPNPLLSVYEGAVHPWKGEVMGEYLQQLLLNAHRFDFPVHTPVGSLEAQWLELLWDGNRYFTGLNAFFKHIESQTYKIQYRVMLSRYRGKTVCPECRGTRLRGDAANVLFHQKSLQELVLMPVSELLIFFERTAEEISPNAVLNRLLPEITQRLRFIRDVGLGYLTLNRAANTLSGGESQRIHLATSLGSSLVGSTYVLDEPSIGLHPRDTLNLIKVLKSLKNLGNTIIIVEHEEDIIKEADFVLEIGPHAGLHGGGLTFEGSQAAFQKSNCLTARYLNGSEEIPVRLPRRSAKEFLLMKNASLHNLHQVTVQIPLNVMVVVTGVSGSGKSTLIKDLLYPLVKQCINDAQNNLYKGSVMEGAIHKLQDIELIDQNPIGKSSRSNPLTYLKIFDEVRNLYAKQPLSKQRNYKPGFFSFNIEGGRCELCQGEGQIAVSMQFMSDIVLPCEECKGTRYSEEALEINYRGQRISDLLDMNLEQLQAFFSTGETKDEKRIAEMIQPLISVGLGYLKAGQSSTTLSGGEAQRIKLAYFLAKGSTQGKTLFVFDEPTTGLHVHDIVQLLKAFNDLIDLGHSLIVIEHNLDVIKSADHLIDLGPEGGIEGGRVVFEGSPEALVLLEENHTAAALRGKIIH